MYYSKKGIPIYNSLDELPTVFEKVEPIHSKYHSKPINRISKINDTTVAKKRSKSRAFKAYGEASIMKDMNEDRIPIPNLFGLYHNNSEIMVLMQYVEGRSLMELLHTSNMDRDKIERVGFEIGNMFYKGYVHGDLAPYHILFCGDDVLFIDLERSKKTSSILSFCNDINSLIHGECGGWSVKFNEKEKLALFDGISESLSSEDYLSKVENVIFKPLTLSNS